jgi:hypothetical protein
MLPLGVTTVREASALTVAAIEGLALLVKRSDAAPLREAATFVPLAFAESVRFAERAAVNVVSWEARAMLVKLPLAPVLLLKPDALRFCEAVAEAETEGGGEVEAEGRGEPEAEGGAVSAAERDRGGEEEAEGRGELEAADEAASL